MANQVTNYKCPACTGPLRFDSATGKLQCDFCGSSYEVAEIEKLYAEKDAQAAGAFRQAEEQAAADGEWTAASGSDVPIATIVSPITSCGIPNFPASAAAPSTNTSAPFTSATKPATSSKIATKIIIFLPLPSFLRMPD